MMALLKLPLARQVSPQLANMERELSGITERSTKAHDMRVNYLLLFSKAARTCSRSQALSTCTAFRFDASRAYRALVKNRLSQLQERREGQDATISDFATRALDPAIGTLHRRRGAPNALLGAGRARDRFDAHRHHAGDGAAEQRAA